MAVTPGTILGHYRIASTIGTGGMGEVYLAEDTRLERRVAIKILPAALIKDEGRLVRFEQEARAVSALNHPNIITLHEIGQTDDAHFMVIEFVEGETLRDRLAREPMELLEVLDVAIQTASALVAAHNAGIIHRDIKPENIMLRPDGYVKVLDFGIAKLSEKLSTQELIQVESENTQIRTPIKTEPGIVMGSPHYMSPEQTRGRMIDQRTDIFSLGVLIYEMVARVRPFDGETISDLIAEILTKEPPPLSTYLPDIPPRLEKLVQKALAKKADDRYAAATEMLADLRRVKRRVEFDSGLDFSVPPESQGAPSRESTPPPASSSSSSSLGANSRENSREGSRGGSRKTLEWSTTQSHDSGQTTVLDLHTLSERQNSGRFWGGADRMRRWGLVGLIILALAALTVYLHVRGTKTPAIRSLAVLPFVNAGGDANSEYLSDGMTESLINNLSHMTELKVVSRNSVFQYKGLSFNPREVRDRLGVDAILSGRVTQRGNDLLISVELIDARDDSQIWGEQFNRKLPDLLAVQQEIANRVSEKLLVKLSGEEKKRLTESGTQNFEAYELYLRGRFHWNKRTPESMRRSLEFFMQATDKDPKYALAYAGLADAYSLLGEYETIPVKEALPKSKAAAARAIELDDSLAEAHTSLAAVYEYEWDWAAAEREYRAAIERNQNYATAHHWYGIFLSSMGRPDEAEAQLKEALSLDPVSLIINTGLGRVYCGARRYDEAIGQLKRTLEMEPKFGEANFQIALAYEGKRNFAEAEKAFEQAVENFQAPAMKGWVAREYAIAGKPAEARRVIDELNALSKQQYVSPFMIAIIYAALGDHDETYRWLERVVNDRSYYVVWLKVDRVFDPFRSEPRFQDLLRRIGLPE